MWCVKVIRLFCVIYLEPGKPLPSVEELYRQVSLILVNTHKSTSKPRPQVMSLSDPFLSSKTFLSSFFSSIIRFVNEYSQMPGIVHVGGAHVKSPKALPSNIQKFIDQSEHGVILFSLGAYLQSSEMPKETIEIILSTLGTFKQRVIWKFEDESIKAPPNVLIKKWLPQSDILAHPNVILFITHGGERNSHKFH